MTAPELTDAARELVERTTAAAGLPLVIEDEGTYRRLATLIGDQRDVPTSGAQERAS